MERKVLFAAAVVSSLITPAILRAQDAPPLRVLANDNRRPAGRLAGGSLTLNLRAGRGLWKPEGEAGPALEVQSLGEESGSLQVPAPLIRVPEGTLVVASVRNDLDAVLRVHGLCSHDGSPCESVDIPPASRREVRFTAARAGTYHYWATTTGMPMPLRVPDAELSGAFIVDPPGGNAEPDRVLVITEWTNLTRDQFRQILDANDPGATFLAMNARFTFLINGLSWPATERMTYELDERIRWRVVNLSSQWHPMHLHGFYFEVEGLGDGLKDAAVAAPDRQQVVTHLMPPGGTMTMNWRAERAGNWLFHCHISEHVSPKRRIAETPSTDAAHAHHGSHRNRTSHDVSAGMAGMILGVTIVDTARASAASNNAPAIPARKLTLVMRTEAGRYGTEPAYGFVMDDGDQMVATDTVSAPGPTLALRRGEPVEITLINRLAEATAIHWHGIELESYYDGVHGWSGAGTRLTPIIEPGTSFTVRFTPPRAGTFIYHTHLHDNRQLTSGMYGALVVVEPGERFDPALDHVVVIGRGGPGSAAQTVLNGEHDPTFVWKAGATHRIRLVNITPDDIFVATLAGSEAPVTWRPVAKDGAPVPPGQAGARPSTQKIAVGETFDFEYDAPAGRQSLWLNVRTPAGKWHVQGRVVVK